MSDAAAAPAASAAHPRGPLGRALDRLYDGCGALAGVAMVLLLASVTASIVSRQLRFNLPGLDAYAGYMMATAGFLALAHTLKHGEHIRVTIVLSALKGAGRRALEVWALFAATLLAALFAFYSCKLAWQSRTFHDISTANDATPLWIPQIAMAVGSIVLMIAFLDELILELRGRRTVRVPAEALRNE